MVRMRCAYNTFGQIDLYHRFIEKNIGWLDGWFIGWLDG